MTLKRLRVWLKNPKQPYKIHFIGYLTAGKLSRVPFFVHVKSYPAVIYSSKMNFIMRHFVHIGKRSGVICSPKLIFKVPTCTRQKLSRRYL